MKVLMLDGKVIDAKIKKAPAQLNRLHGFVKMAHWNTETGPCSTPVETGKFGATGDIKYKERL